jgi:hypothetical protein
VWAYIYIYIPIIPLKGCKQEKLEVHGGYLRVFSYRRGFSVNRWKFGGVYEVSPIHKLVFTTLSHL